MRALFIFVAACAALACSSAVAQTAYGLKLPPRAVEYLPQLVEQQRAIWPDAPVPSFMGAQVEQETCISMTHSKCWNPRAELKTSRENGIGLGQFTRAYRADGSIRFDKISELAAAHKSLRGWSWESRYDPRYQLTAIVEMDKAIFYRIKDAANPVERLGLMLSAYNGGESGVMQDRLLCSNTKNCNPAYWRGNVELYSLKSKTPKPGYGKSFFHINREYVQNVLGIRRPKYDPYF